MRCPVGPFILLNEAVTVACGASLQIFSFFMLTGVLSTLLIPETNQKTLEALSNERQDRFFGFLGERLTDITQHRSRNSQAG